MSQITDFFISNGLDNRGRSLKQMQEYSFGEMEAVHDFQLRKIHFIPKGFSRE